MWIEQVKASATWPLRQKVLRPWLPVAEVGMPGDGDPGTVHLAVLDDTETVLCSLRLQPQACPWRPEEPAAWQLRSMATDPASRGTGLGARLVAAAVLTVAEGGGRLLWCNARESAEGFYLRCGFTALDERWDIPGIGPHVGMLRPVPDPDRSGAAESGGGELRGEPAGGGEGQEPDRGTTVRPGQRLG